jgi:lysophospholipase L1-like esterase
MKTSGTPIKNILLVVFSVLFVFIVTLCADRLLGILLRPPNLPDTVELIFPPFAEQHFKTIDFEYTANINSIGIRDRELPKERGDAFRVLAIGDSYTYGWGVAQEETWPHLLEVQLREEGHNVEILNLGKPGTGPPFYAELAERAIPLLRPDLVIVGMLQGNDLRDAGPETAMPTTEDFWRGVRRLYPNIAGMMRDMQRERIEEDQTHEKMPPQVTTAEDNRRWTVNTAAKFVENMSEEQRVRFEALEEKVRTAFMEGNLNPYMIDLAIQDPDAYTKATDPDDPWTQVCIERAAARFATIKTVADKYNCKVVVVIIPEGPYVNSHALKNMARVGYVMPEWLLETNGIDRSIQIACEKAEVAFFAVTEDFREHKKDAALYFELDGHPTVKANHLFAEAITPVIKGLIEK